MVGLHAYGWMGLVTATTSLFGLVAADGSFVEFECSGSTPPGTLDGTCETEFLVPHFDGNDEVGAYLGRIESVLATSWRVKGDVWDATGTHYFSWNCHAEASTVLDMSISGGCGYSRPPFVNTLGVPYEADASGPQRVRVTATTENCAEAVLGCPFSSHVRFDLHD